MGFVVIPLENCILTVESNSILTDSSPTSTKEGSAKRAAGLHYQPSAAEMKDSRQLRDAVINRASNQTFCNTYPIFDEKWVPVGADAVLVVSTTWLENKEEAEHVPDTIIADATD